ncbi:Cysteine and histidine-rich domain-containing protein 1 [Liparis tanakae]|uniref:Cysteine and histidine-rich domain-containing protein 1 n=1 Tax=Liparis tanakae TaxID=230148 RepID=A0A4Z2HWR1_9TELE|nr:Cysteine and histidine-rich domain-containing protein 1 [Liparis tanakae]
MLRELERGIALDTHRKEKNNTGSPANKRCPSHRTLKKKMWSLAIGGVLSPCIESRKKCNSHCTLSWMEELVMPTTFSAMQGCTRGCHSNEKPQEPLRPEVSSDKADVTKRPHGEEMIYRGPKSAETLQKERPSSEEPKTKLPHKVSASLAQVLEKLDISKKAEEERKESQEVMNGTRCKNAGCKGVFRGLESDLELCTHHPGGPVFHEGYKYWNCCCIRTIDFNAFLDQKGCSTGKHRWIPKQVVEVKQSSVLLLPSKVEVTLRKADRVAWGKLEDPNHKVEVEAEPEDYGQEAEPNDRDIDDNDISDSDEEWAYDTAKSREEKESLKARGEEKEEKEEKEAELLKTKEVEEEMRKALEEKKRAEEEKAKLEEERRQEAGGGYEDMPELE